MSELEKLVKKQKTKTAFPTWEVIEAIVKEINKLEAPTLKAPKPTPTVERKTKIEPKTPEKTREV